MSDIEIYDEKNKLATALFAFFLGGIGVHRFYLGQTGRGVLSLVFFWTFIPSIIAFFDFIIFLSMSQDKFDRKYNPQLYQRQQKKLGNAGWNVSLPNVPNHENVVPTVRQSAEDKLLEEVNTIQGDILKTIQSSPEFKSGIVSEIKPLVNNYIGQVKELIDRDKNIKKVVEQHSLSEIDEKIFELNSKLSETMSEILKQEYRKSLDRYLHHKESLRELYDQREMISLRLDATIMSLREVKFDLLRLQNMNADEQRSGFFQLFDAKSTELSDYLTSLRQTYDENRLV